MPHSSPGEFRTTPPSLSYDEAKQLADAIAARHRGWTASVAVAPVQLDEAGLAFFASIGIEPGPAYMVRINLQDSGIASRVQQRVVREVKQLAESEQGLGRAVSDASIEVYVAKAADHSRGR